jgi:low affinity Fe/Cu permease
MSERQKPPRKHRQESEPREPGDDKSSDHRRARSVAHVEKHKRSLFTCFATATAHASGHPVTFVAAVAIIVLWGVSGPLFGFSDTWQLIINTSTTIVTFLMVFLIQNTQNRDSTAMHLKLDEIIRALDGAHNTLMNLEDLGDKDLQAIHKRYVALAESAEDALERDDVEAAADDIQALKRLKRSKSTHSKATHSKG